MIFCYLPFVGYNKKNHLYGNYQSFLHLKLFDPKSFQWHSFAFVQLQYSDGSPLNYDGIRVKLTHLVVDSDIYIIPFGSSEFWAFRGKSSKLDRVRLPAGKNWSTSFAYTLQGKLIF